MVYKKLEIYLSKERLNKYLELASNDKDESIKLYKKNLKISSKMYILLSCFEVFFRNIINNSISNNYWIININNLHIKILEDLKKYQTLSKTKSNQNISKFFDIQNTFIQKAKDDLIKEKKPISNDYLISKLNFAFWENLLSKNYENIIWNKYLKNTFKCNRGYLQKEINNFRKLRNRIEHNECILKYDIQNFQDRIFKILDLVDSDLKEFIKEMSQDL